MSIWQLTAQIAGYVEANTPEKDRGGNLSDREFDELSRYIDRKAG